MAFTKRKPSEAHRSDYRDQLAGREINDPYRWMEEDTPALRAWVRARHEYTVAQLLSLAAAPDLHIERLTKRYLAPLPGHPDSGKPLTRSFSTVG